jgi:uncharacterized membrane protein YGL010W
MPNIDFEQALSEYKSQHQTAGCIVTHMLGVPMIALSFPLLIINPRKSLTLFFLGWTLQLIGHYYFERNKPVLFTRTGKNFWVPIVAMLMVSKYWRAVLTGNCSIERQNGKINLLPYR